MSVFNLKGLKRVFVPVENKKVEINIIGSGENTLILLSGWTHDFQYEKDFLIELSKYYKVVTISYPGYLGSEENRHAQKMWFLASLVDEVVHKLNLKNYKLLGFSMGCQVALKYIDKYNKNTKAILISPTSNSPKDMLNVFQNLIIQSKILIGVFRENSKLKVELINLAYGKIGKITENSDNKSYFKDKSVTLNGAFDTLIALLTSYTNPLKYKNNIMFIFGDNEILQNKLKEKKVDIIELENASHGAFKTKYKEIVKLIKDNDV
jgi:hypothetical protein